MDSWSALESGAALVALPGNGVFVLEGPDTARFCNGMFTNNYRDMPVGGGARSAACDDRGRITGMLAIYRTDEQRFLAVLDGIEPAAFAKKYGMYIVFDDVEMEDLTEDAQLFTLQGRGAEALLTAAGLPVPADQVAVGDGVTVLRRSRGDVPGFDLLVEAGDPREALLAAGAIEADGALLTALRVRAGEPTWPRDMTDKQLVHDIGIKEQLTHFEKGCYVGQETINRTEVMGKPKKDLRVVVLDGDVLPEDGAVVQLGDKKVGRFSSAAVLPGTGVAGLAILRLEAGEEGTRVEVLDGEQRFSATVRRAPLS